MQRERCGRWGKLSALLLCVLSGKVMALAESLPVAPAASAAAITLDDGKSRVELLDDKALPMGMTAEQKKATDGKRNAELRRKCKKVTDLFDNDLCERPQQVELNAELDKYLKMVEGKQARWPGVDVAAEQQAWLAQRDACRQDPDVKMCLEFSYLKRLSIMQAQFALVPEEKPLSYRCDGEPEPMTVRFHSTNPPLVTLERSGKVSYAWMMPTGNGVYYEGEGLRIEEKRAALLLEEAGKATRCVLAP